MKILELFKERISHLIDYESNLKIEIQFKPDSTKLT